MLRVLLAEASLLLSAEITVIYRRAVVLLYETRSSTTAAHCCPDIPVSGLILDKSYIFAVM